jgi:hypothetical protein
MWLILLEALGALLIFIWIVWWTMFSGRRGGERLEEPDRQDGDKARDQDGPPSRPAP